MHIRVLIPACISVLCLIAVVYLVVFDTSGPEVASVAPEAPLERTATSTTGATAGTGALDDPMPAVFEDTATQSVSTQPDASAVPAGGATAVHKAEQDGALPIVGSARSEDTLPTPSSPAISMSVVAYLQLMAPLDTELTVTSKPGGRVTGVSMFPFCAATDAKAEAMLTELCMDDCTTAAERALLRAELCVVPSYVRKELTNSHYDQSSVQQLGFDVSFREPDEYYIVRLVAQKSDMAWIETRDGENSLVSRVVFPVAVGSVATYRVAQGADGALELRQVQLDLEGDGSTDFSLSHAGTPVETLLAMVRRTIVQAHVATTDRLQLNDWLARAEDILVRRDVAAATALRDEIRVSFPDVDPDNPTSAEACAGMIGYALEMLVGGD